jgi:hypothetical protein
MSADATSRNSPAEDSVTPTKSASAPRFTERSATARRLLDDELIGLPDEALALITTEGGERAERASLILGSRFRGLLVRAAENLCRQLAHLGIRGLCQRVRCDEAFHSAYMSLLRQVLGQDIRTGEYFEETVIDQGHPGNKSNRQSACTRWLNRPEKKKDIPLAGWIGQELQQQGRAEDARRQWNKDRQLLQRMVLPNTVEQALRKRIEAVQQMARDDGKHDPFTILGLDESERSLHRIADRLYIDACDCWFSDEEIGTSRVARYLGLIADRDELTENIISVITLIDWLFLCASDDDGEDHNRAPDQRFYERYFKSARRLTRTINRYTIDESRIVDDETHLLSADFENQR